MSFPPREVLKFVHSSVVGQQSSFGIHLQSVEKLLENMTDDHAGADKATKNSFKICNDSMVRIRVVMT